MTICPPVCPFVGLLARICKSYWLHLPDKNQKMGFGLTLISLSFESDLDYRLDTKYLDFSIQLHSMADVCALQVLLLSLVSN